MNVLYGGPFLYAAQKARTTGLMFFLANFPLFVWILELVQDLTLKEI